MANHSTQLLRALRSHDFRLYFAGQFISLAGTWMQQIAMSWLAYSLTHSAFVLGLIGFASQLPILAFGGFGGVWSDRVDRRRLLMWTQSLAMIQALLIAGLAWKGWISAPVLVSLAFILGCINAVDLPARQSFVVYLVEDREQLPNAIALNSMLINSTRFVGPALAGFVVAFMGEAVCFLINALSYLAVLLALRAIRARAGEGSAIPALQALKEGLSYTFNHPDIRTPFIDRSDGFSRDTLYRLDAHLCQEYLWRRCKYLRHAYQQHGGWLIDGRPVSRQTHIHNRASPQGVDLLRGQRSGTGGFCAQRQPGICLPDTHGAWLFHDHRRCGRKHDDPDMGSRRHARQGDGDLLDGLPGDGSSWKSCRRKPRACCRGQANPPCLWSSRHADRACSCLPPSPEGVVGWRMTGAADERITATTTP
ncbi:MAG: MFS transporter [Thiobacillaceae bacterium]